MKSLFVIAVLGATLAVPLPVRAQQADDPAIGQNGEPDLAIEVHQLKAEIDRLSRELERVSGELEKLQNDHRAQQAAAPAPAKEVALAPRPPTPTATLAAPTSTKPTRPKADAVKANPTSAKGNPALQPTSAETDDRTPSTVLVFQDGRHIEARNYAIVGQTVWVYTEQDSKRFPLSDLNVEETRRTNAERGVAFQLPPTK